MSAHFEGLLMVSDFYLAGMTEKLKWTLMGIVYGSFASWVLLCKPWSLQVEFQVAGSKPLLPFSFCSMCCVFQAYGGLLCLKANCSSSGYVTVFFNWSKESEQAFAVPGHLLANRRRYCWGTTSWWWFFITRSASLKQKSQAKRS